MKTTIGLIFVCAFLSPFGKAFAIAKQNKTFLIANKATEIFLKRQKRYLIFEKGAAVTFQGNIGKSVIAGYPRGLNEIAEYTLIYDLPTDYHVFHRKTTTTTTTKATTTATAHHPYIYSYKHGYTLNDYYGGGFNKNPIQRKYVKEKLSKLPCYKENFYDSAKKISKICLRRTKRNFHLSKLATSERMFYDLMEKWSLIHGFLPRYCFMRTLCESSHLLLPYGYSLLHDIIHILLRYTKPWAFHHKIFGRALRQQHHIDECAKQYGPYCRVSWLHFITNVVHGSRAADFMR